MKEYETPKAEIITLSENSFFSASDENDNIGTPHETWHIGIKGGK